MTASEIRKDAREALKGKWGKAVCIVLIYLAFSFIVGLVEGIVGEGTALYAIIDLAYLVMSIPLSFGLIISFMKLKRGEEISCFDFFKDGFARFGKAWGICFHTFLRLLLPIICLVLVILVMGFIISLNAVSGNVGLSIGLTILTVVLYISTLIYVVTRSFLYVIAYNIGYDSPELSSKACVLKSEALMKGNRGNYFLLELSFIGWAILACFTFGIGMLWLMPYICIAEVCFYEKVAKKNQPKVEDPIKMEE